MKKTNILFAGLALLCMSSCDDYLTVEAPSAFGDEYVFSNITEANRLLNGVYASLASNNTFGQAFINTYTFNSDVEYYAAGTEPSAMTSTRSFFRQYNCTSDAGELLKTWNEAYKSIERANHFVSAAQKSDLYASGDTTILQMIGEAKCMRAMNYLELVQMMGDIPFDLRSTSDAGSLIKPIVDRDLILTTLIEDLRSAAPSMKFASNLSEGIERCSKEFAWSLIARLSLCRGGYSMRKGATAADNGVMQRPSDYKEYYTIARNYCDSVINSGEHALNKNYFDVFIDECNYKVTNNDDPIFEIPFTMEENGNVGYIHGPRSEAGNGSATFHNWGTTKGETHLNYFHRFTYDPADTRRNCIGFWSYNDRAAGITPALLNGEYNYCNKWSKLWDESHRQGKESQGNTGINFPYMRYADVLLMFAEAENEINEGPTDAAKSTLKQVRARAFRNAANAGEMVDSYVDGATTKDAFFELIFKERAWEFAGEGARWKDLVRWNLLSRVVYQQFFKYFAYATSDYGYDWEDTFDKYPRAVYYKIDTEENAHSDLIPNKELPILKFFTYVDTKTQENVDNLWQPINFANLADDDKPSINGQDPWTMAQWGNWEDEATGTAKSTYRLGFSGYIYADQNGIIQAGVMGTNSDQIINSQDWGALPAVRYILPLPADAIARSEGQYRNYYGY